MGKKPRGLYGTLQHLGSMADPDQHAVGSGTGPVAPGPAKRRGEAHAITRARERYGLDLTEQDLVEISAALSRDGILVARQRDGCIWITKAKDKVVRLAVSHGGNIMTFLPANHRLRKGRW